jgi:glucose/mannose-6-phosphate isomerase
MADLVLESIKKLPDQIKQAWAEVSAINLSEKYLNPKKVVICGMGGSALGGRVIQALYAFLSEAPIEVFTGYHIPKYVDSETLVIICSYSGNTEESVNCFAEAQKTGGNLFAIATGGKIKELADEHKIAAYIFDPRENPSGQPRMSLGYSIASILALLAKVKTISVFDKEIEEVIISTKGFLSRFDNRKDSENTALNMANKLQGKIPVLVSSEHLFGVAHVFKNQINENAKTMALSFDIPELNHHLMEGLKNPTEAKELLHFVFLESKIYSKRVQKRYPLTMDVVNKNGYQHSSYTCEGISKLSQVFEVLALSSYLSFYLSEIYHEDASKIPWVDYFKEKLA